MARTDALERDTGRTGELRRPSAGLRIAYFALPTALAIALASAAHFLGWSSVVVLWVAVAAVALMAGVGTAVMFGTRALRHHEPRLPGQGTTVL